MDDTLPLRDIHLPDPVSWFPPAIGWWLLLAGLLLLGWLVHWLIKRARQPRLQQRAKRELEAVIEGYLLQGDKQDFIRQLSIALKRIGMSYFERAQVAGASGTPWLHRLNGLVERGRLSEQHLQLLATAPYQPAPALDDAQVDALIVAMRRWASALPARTEATNV